MVTRAHFCIKCGRPIDHPGYCEDCANELKAGIRYRCSFCGKSNLMSPLAYNVKTKHVYCKDCLNAFVNGLRTNGFKEGEIKRIIDKDFIPLK